MKLKLLIATGALSLCTANAATITVSPGAAFLNQGLTVLLDGTALMSFNVAVGNLDSGIFTQFATTQSDSGTVNGDFTATGPASLNSQLIHVFVGTGTTIDNSDQFVVLQTNTGTTFPADVSQAGGTTFNAALGAGLTVVSSLNGAIEGNTVAFTTVPEPSALLLSAFGVLGLLRRKR